MPRLKATFILAIAAVAVIYLAIDCAAIRLPASGDLTAAASEKHEKHHAKGHESHHGSKHESSDSAKGEKGYDSKHA